MAEKNTDKVGSDFGFPAQKVEPPEPPPAEEPKPEVKEPEPEPEQQFSGPEGGPRSDDRTQLAPPPPPLPYTPQVPPLTDQEILEVRWIVWGKCPSCGESVRGWNPGPFHAGRYTMWQSQGIHVLSGHREECPDKYWRRQS